MSSVALTTVRRCKTMLITTHASARTARSSGGSVTSRCWRALPGCPVSILDHPRHMNRNGNLLLLRGGALDKRPTGKYGKEEPIAEE